MKIKSETKKYSYAIKNTNKNVHFHVIINLNIIERKWIVNEISLKNFSNTLIVYTKLEKRSTIYRIILSSKSITLNDVAKVNPEAVKEFKDFKINET